MLHLESAPEDSAACEEHRRIPDDVVVRETPTTDDLTSVTVPAHSHRRAWVTYRFNRPPLAIGEAQRRLLLVAGRVCGSCLARLEAVGAVEAQLSEARQIAQERARILGHVGRCDRSANTIPRIAAASVPVLLYGETGVGKSFVARLIHEASERAGEPMRVINCASIPESLLESELFGHERGSFTGASATREGALEAAGNGTLFLDEIGGTLAREPGEASSCHRREEVRAHRLQPNLGASGARHLRDQPRPGRDVEGRPLSQRPLLPDLRRLGPDPAAARSRGRPRAPRQADPRRPEADRVASHRRVFGRRPRCHSSLPMAGKRPGASQRDRARDRARRGSQIEPTDFPEPLGVLLGEDEPEPAAPESERVTSVRLPARLDEIEAIAIKVALKATGGNRTKAAALLGINRATLHRKLEP